MLIRRAGSINGYEGFRGEEVQKPPARVSLGGEVPSKKKPPLPSIKVGLDTTLNLSSISQMRTPHPLPSALRTPSGATRTVRGSQRTVRMHHDFGRLEAFYRREREFASHPQPHCKYPWGGGGDSATTLDVQHGGNSVSFGGGPQQQQKEHQHQHLHHQQQGTRRRPQAGSSCPPPLPFDSDESWKTAGYGRGSSGSAGMWASGGTSGGVGAALGVGGGGDDRFTPSLTQRSSLRTSRSSGTMLGVWGEGGDKHQDHLLMQGGGGGGGGSGLISRGSLGCLGRESVGEGSWSRITRTLSEVSDAGERAVVVEPINGYSGWLEGMEALVEGRRHQMGAGKSVVPVVGAARPQVTALD